MHSSPVITERAKKLPNEYGRKSIAPIQVTHTSVKWPSKDICDRFSLHRDPPNGYSFHSTIYVYACIHSQYSHFLPRFNTFFYLIYILTWTSKCKHFWHIFPPLIVKDSITTYFITNLIIHHLPKVILF
jgi:hypothetical protein